MNYAIEFKPKSIKDLKKTPQAEVDKIFIKIELMKLNLHGDVKKLTNFTPEYRLRVGNYRILFEVEDKAIVIYRVVSRKDAYS